jgi:serine protease Do
MKMRKDNLKFGIVLTLIIFQGLFLFAQQESNNSSINTSRQNAITRAIEQGSPAIVGINITEVRQYTYNDPFANDPFFSRFFGRRQPRVRQQEVHGLGSGFIISPDGYILTNHHVAGNASKVVITLTNGKKYDADIIGADMVADVALLKINEKNLPYLKLADSDDLIIGEWAIAFGNPFGLFDINAKPTVTVGVISNKGVSFLSEGRVYKGMIQTDAAISSGNSGGPLMNSVGEVIGMNTVIFSTAQSQSGSGSIGIGFSIPINRVKKIVELLKKHKTIDRDYWTGLEAKEIDEQIARYLKTDNKEGIVVYSIKRNSPAEDAGLEPGDLIMEIDGHPINRDDDFVLIINDGIAGDTLDFTIQRDNQILHKKLFLKPAGKKQRESRW